MHLRLIGLLMLLLPVVCSATTLEPLLPEPLPIGTWENRTQGDLIGLHLNPGDICEIYVERALQKRSTRSCRYEKFEDRFQIFLVDTNGHCDTAADFDFIFEPAAPLIRLQTGSEEVLLQKVQNVPLQKAEPTP